MLLKQTPRNAATALHLPSHIRFDVIRMIGLQSPQSRKTKGFGIASVMYIICDKYGFVREC